MDRYHAPVQDDLSTAAESAEQRAESGRGATRRQIRGSALLVAGRMLAIGANLISQVLIARYLSIAEFGSFAYALSLVALVQSVVALGFDRAISRFLPVYDEQHDHNAFYGTLLFVIGVTLAVGAFAYLLVMGLSGWLTGTLVEDDLAVALLAILILMAPIEALDGVMTDLFAVFASARAIFVRRYVIGPGLRLLVVGLLVVGQQTASFLAIGYVAAGVLGIVLYTTMIPGMLRERGVLAAFDRHTLRLPLREILSYTAPMLTSDLVIVFMAGIDAAILGFLHGTEAVGSLRVVESAARTNSFVFASFSILFAPAAARYFARGNQRAMADMYWQSAAWMAVLSFPVFAVTFSLAEPVTVFLFDDRYRSSAIFLALLALGRYLDVAFGSNGQALRVFGPIRYTVIVNLAAAGIHLGAALVLIPPLGALGAALSVVTTFAMYNLMKQLALSRVSAIPAFDRAYLPVYLAIAGGAILLGIVEVALDLPLVVAIILAAAVSLGVLLVGRQHLRLAETFPELARMPILRWLA